MENQDSKWLVTGASGRLGLRLCATQATAGRTVIAQHLNHPVPLQGVETLRLDLADADAVCRALAQAAPDMVVHCAANSDVDACERDLDQARRINVDCSRNVAQAAAETGARLIHISTDQIWDGSQPWVGEDTPPAPINAYGRTKAEAERVVAETHEQALILRTNFYGRGAPGRPSFSDWVLDGLRAGRELTMFTDVFYTPIALAPLCRTIMEVAATGASGLLHVCGLERVSKYQLGQALARAFGLPENLLKQGKFGDVELFAPRPREMSMATDRVTKLLGHPMPDTAASIESLSHEN